MRSDLEHLRSVFMAVENGDLGMLKSIGIKDSELGDVKFFLEKLVKTGFLDWMVTFESLPPPPPSSSPSSRTSCRCCIAADVALSSLHQQTLYLMKPNSSFPMAPSSFFHHKSSCAECILSFFLSILFFSGHLFWLQSRDKCNCKHRDNCRYENGNARTNRILCVSIIRQISTLHNS